MTHTGGRSTLCIVFSLVETCCLELTLQFLMWVGTHHTVSGTDVAVSRCGKSQADFTVLGTQPRAEWTPHPRRQVIGVGNPLPTVSEPQIIRTFIVGRTPSRSRFPGMATNMPSPQVSASHSVPTTLPHSLSHRPAGAVMPSGGVWGCHCRRVTEHFRQKTLPRSEPESWLARVTYWHGLFWLSPTSSVALDKISPTSAWYIRVC